jgi:CRP/FNR family transcriptional regulator, cyclic AMP receptor protein
MTVATSKSGLRTLRAGEILFHDGDVADSLYIIQKGQIRLFKPKGKGFIEIGVLRSGEVIGEMAFFDDDGSGKKRSCSAAAITGVDIIEISFPAFGKTMQSLNPWFKTIINTLATRLRKANSRIKELEDNQASLSYGGKHSTYEFMKPIEVMRVLGTLFLVFRAHGEIQENALALHKKLLTLYTLDMYQIIEVKLESILGILLELGWMELQEDEEHLPHLLLMKNVEVIRQIFIFYNSERHLPEEKKLKVSEKCEAIIAKMLEKLNDETLIDIPNLKITDDIRPKYTQYFILNEVIEDFKARNIALNPDHLDDGRNIGLFGEVLQQDGKVFVEADMAKVKKLYPVIRFMNAVKRSNLEKSTAG